jgi:hypothetical protein
MSTGDLFGQAHVPMEGVAGLPLITNPAGEALVFVPGYLYKPTPLDIQRIGKAGPAALNDTEHQFLQALIRHLGAEAQVTPDQLPAAIKGEHAEYFLLRNIDRSPGATRFRVGYGNWFYPDFIFWIVDHSQTPQTQRLCYIDPKGLEMGARGGWLNHKLQCLIYKLAEIGQAHPTATLNDGSQVNLRFKGAIVSTTPHAQLQGDPATRASFEVFDDQGKRHFPSQSEFAQAGIFFAESSSYIAQMMQWLSRDDTVLEQVMRQAATVFALPERAAPTDEIGAFALSLRLHHADNINAVLDLLIRHCLNAKSVDQALARLQAQARKELQPCLSRKKSLKGSLLGMIDDPERISDPCTKWFECLREEARLGE